MMIRPTTKADIPAVDALLARAYPVLLKPDYPASVLVTALPLISRAQPALVTCGTYFGVFVEGGIVSAGGWTRGQPGGGRGRAKIGHIRHVVTDPAHTRRGYGSALMEHVLATARAAGITEMRCQATRTAVPFYAACGFEILGAIEVPLRPGISFPAIAMRSFL